VVNKAEISGINGEDHFKKLGFNLDRAFSLEEKFQCLLGILLGLNIFKK